MFLLKSVCMKPQSILLILLFLSLTTEAQNLPKIIQPEFRKDTINISKLGGRADGITLNTEVINNAIQSTSAKGGGVVVLPKGFWLSGPIVLRNNVNLHLQK